MSVVAGKVLLVDSNQSCLERTSTLLRTKLELFITVVTAKSLDQAVVMLTQHPDLEAIIYDFKTVGEDPDGTLAIRTLRKFTGIPIIATIAEEMYKLELIAEQAGILDIVSTSPDGDKRLLKSVVKAIASVRRTASGNASLERKVDIIKGLMENASDTQKEMVKRLRRGDEQLEKHETTLYGDGKKKVGLVKEVEERKAVCIGRSKRLTKAAWITFGAFVTAIAAGIIAIITKT